RTDSCRRARCKVSRRARTKSRAGLGRIRIVSIAVPPDDNSNDEKRCPGRGSRETVQWPRTIGKSCNQGDLLNCLLSRAATPLVVGRVQRGGVAAGVRRGMEQMEAEGARRAWEVRSTAWGWRASRGRGQVAPLPPALQPPARSRRPASRAGPWSAVAADPG